MSKYTMIFDKRRCVGCNACVVACQQNYDLPPENKLNWVSVEEEGDFPNITLDFHPQLCAHCDRPTCIEPCPVAHATFKTKEGYVLVNEELCIGCSACVPSCPYGARSMNADTNKAVKCSFCANLVEFGEEPVCVRTCPTRARIFGDAEDSNSEVAKILSSNEVTRYDVLIEKEEGNLGPNVFYK